ncbi:MAG: hypothetical protein JKY48_09485 [Flavobacteriales bacterium]|nr:hypothetical protein [Flavobacteriales bacterium]
MGVDFCYVISHGFAARMLLQTNLITKLTQQGYSVALISPDATDENLLALAENNANIKLVEWKTKASIWDDDYLHKRMYFLEDLSKNTALKEKFYNSLFYSKSKHPWKRIRPLVYYGVYLLNKLFPIIRKSFLKGEKKHLKSEEAVAILKELQPKLLVATYPVSIIEAKIIHEAKENNIATLLHLLSWDNITCKGIFPAVADNYIAWGNIMSDELKEFYNIGDEQISICGVPHFDEHVRIREQGITGKLITELGLSKELPYLFIAMSSPRFAPKEIDIVEWLSAAVEQGVFGEKMQLIVRPHPQNVQTYMADNSWLKRLDRLTSEKVAVSYPSLSQSKIRWSMKKTDMPQLSELIAGCTMCLNSGSTVSIDALMHNKPVLLTSFDGEAQIPYWNSARRLIDYPHLKKLIEEGGAVPVHSYSELKSKILSYIERPDHDLLKRRNALLKECYKDDGNSTKRVIESLTSVLNQVR